MEQAISCLDAIGTSVLTFSAAVISSLPGSIAAFSGEALEKGADPTSEAKAATGIGLASVLLGMLCGVLVPAYFDMPSQWRLVFVLNGSTLAFSIGFTCIALFKLGGWASALLAYLITAGAVQLAYAAYGSTPVLVKVWVLILLGLACLSIAGLYVEETRHVPRYQSRSTEPTNSHTRGVVFWLGSLLTVLEFLVVTLGWLDKAL